LGCREAKSLHKSSAATPLMKWGTNQNHEPLVFTTDITGVYLNQRHKYLPRAALENRKTREDSEYAANARACT